MFVYSTIQFRKTPKPPEKPAVLEKVEGIDGRAAVSKSATGFASASGIATFSQCPLFQ
jgi:hypothetical protein